MTRLRGAALPANGINARPCALRRAAAARARPRPVGRGGTSRRSGGACASATKRGCGGRGVREFAAKARRSSPATKRARLVGWMGRNSRRSVARISATSLATTGARPPRFGTAAIESYRARPQPHPAASRNESFEPCVTQREPEPSVVGIERSRSRRISVCLAKIRLHVDANASARVTSSRVMQGESAASRDASFAARQARCARDAKPAPA